MSAFLATAGLLALAAVILSVLWRLEREKNARLQTENSVLKASIEQSRRDIQMISEIAASSIADQAKIAEVREKVRVAMERLGVVRAGERVEDVFGLGGAGKERGHE